MQEAFRRLSYVIASAGALLCVSTLALGASHSEQAAKAAEAREPPAAPASPAPASPAVQAGSAQAGAAQADSPVERGAFLIRMGGCNDCHTPWKLDEEIGMAAPDMTRMLSGHPSDAPDPVSELKAPDMGVIGPTFTSFRMPFGVVYASNLTPHPQRGLGSWTADQFVRAMRTGRHAGGGRPILPPMPWVPLSQLPDDDLRAMHAYLMSIPASDNRVPTNKVDAAARDRISASYGRLREKLRSTPGAGH